MKRHHKSSFTLSGEIPAQRILDSVGGPTPVASACRLAYSGYIINPASKAFVITFEQERSRNSA